MKKYICNPISLPYRYQAKRNATGGADMFREAADPTLIRFHHMYYLFVSMSGGFWYSKDLYQWDFKETPELPNYDYAPDVHEVDGRMIFSASKSSAPCTFYASADPLNEPFVPLGSPFPFWDPALFQDDDKRLYLYWGCGNSEPLWAVELDRTSFTPLGEKIAVMQAQHAAHGWERIGENNCNPNSHPYIEGVFVNKHNGKYYLQYSAPGTEFNVYSNGVYVADAPLGPFTYQAHNPFSSRPGGFITAAGHGSTRIFTATGGISPPCASASTISSNGGWGCSCANSTRMA
jgi:beta-xylosidase